ncbi:MAG: hypothetical protein H6725_12465 [Sandaracinaceae bacterium]|nr:hypothetical protein [Sandaracinaceae bacterium]
MSDQLPETNRELYVFIAALVSRNEGHCITLQAYLENLSRLARPWAACHGLPLADFTHVLQAAFEPVPDSGGAPVDASTGYLAWERRVAEQIRDLREMREAGTLDNEHRYFGVDAPRGSRWFNFDPCTYLECAAAGTTGGWREGDDTGRAYVPGKVAVLDESGELRAVDPREIEDPVVALREISWEDFTDFVEAGQWYE